MNKRFVYFVIFSFSLFYGISTPNLKATEEIISENVIDDEDNKNTQINKSFLKEEDSTYYDNCDDFNENKDDQDYTLEEKTSFQTILKRTILKSTIETLSTSLSHTYFKKTTNKKYEVQKFRYDELLKILLTLAVDETIPNPKSSLLQKYIELLIPTIAAFLVIDCTKESFIQNDKFLNNDKKIEYFLSLSPKLAIKLFCKLIRKLMMVRFLQRPGTRSYQMLNAFAIVSSFFTINNNGETPKEKYFSFDCLDAFNGTEQFILDQFVRVPIELIDLGKHLNPRHRKKAFAKLIQILLKATIVQDGINKAYEYFYPNVAI